jgi:UDP-N-acetylglucosamine 2-epimerase (non-hydrolysing)
MKICIIVGTRPEIIKMSPVIHLCEQKNIDYFIIHSNQHYSASMDEIFFKELNLPAPKYNLNVGSGKHSNQTGNILIKIEPILEEEKPDYVLVQGDTNTVLAGGLAAAKLDIKVGHVEAGLRSYDRKMPEETNRIVTDHLSSFLFAVTKNQENILKSEAVEANKVHVVGNTVVDAALQNIKLAEKKSNILETLNLKSKEYVLLTAHRSSNVDYKNAFAELLKIVEYVSNSETIVWPIHPRAKKKLTEFGLEVPKNVKTIEPVGFMDFLKLQKNAKLAMTDSGGVQEECCILGTPCVTLRENTERPETVDVGANILVGRNLELATNSINKMLAKGINWENPFGDGTTSKQIIEIIEADYFGKPVNKEDSKSISVIGLGYMGLPMACLLAGAGHEVHGVDINPTKVDEINNGVCPFDEVGMQEVLDIALENKFTASTSPQKSDVFLISVPTPEKDNKCDLTYVKLACESILPHLEDGNLVIIESTIRPGTCELMQKEVFSKTDKKILIAHCPERAIPGNTIHELIYNDRLVGGLCEDSTNKAFDVYKSFSKGNIYKTAATTAECCKLMENTFRDVNIALANEFDVVLKDYGVNPWEAIELANKHPRVNILTPGPGVGGHCIAIDPWFLTENTDKAELIPLARKINNNRPNYYVQMIKELAKKSNQSKVGVLGVAYKKNVDDARETPAKYIIDGLKSENLEFKVHDPYVKNWDYDLSELDEVTSWADILILITDHDSYKGIDLKNKPIIDTRNLFS